MKISELIEILEGFKSWKGDTDVCVEVWTTNDEMLETPRVSFEQGGLVIR